MGTQRDRAEEARRYKLEEIAQRVRDGTLTIRPMTPEERKKHPKPDLPRRPRRRF
jgi:hypothetical protein